MTLMAFGLSKGKEWGKGSSEREEGCGKSRFEHINFEQPIRYARHLMLIRVASFKLKYHLSKCLLSFGISLIPFQAPGAGPFPNFTDAAKLIRGDALVWYRLWCLISRTVVVYIFTWASF